MDEHLEKRQDLLAARLKAGNHEAAIELVDRYYEQIYLFMRRLSDGEYRVVFGDLRVTTVSAEELIELQARMLQRKTWH